MKETVLIANTRHFIGGGDSTYAFALAALLRERGHEVSFFAMKDARNVPDPNSDLFVEHVDYRALHKRITPAAGVVVMSRAVYSVEARRRFARLLDRCSPDVVHLQNIHAHITPSIVIEAHKRKIPVVWTLHDYKLVCPNSHLRNDRTGQVCERCAGGRFYSAVGSRCKKNSLFASTAAAVEAYVHRTLGLLDRVSVLISPSDFLRSKLIQMGIPAKKLCVIPHFITDVPSQAAHVNGTSYVLFLGKTEPLKGIDVLVAAARLHPEVKVVVAGVADPAAREGWPPNIEYVGPQDREGVGRVLQKAWALVLPSIWYENQPFSILEAFASAKPAVASDLGGMRELIGQNERGLLVPPGDPHALGAALAKLCADSALRERLGTAAHAYVTSTHSRAGHYEQIAQVYQTARANGCRREETH